MVSKEIAEAKILNWSHSSSFQKKNQSKVEHRFSQSSIREINKNWKRFLKVHKFLSRIFCSESSIINIYLRIFSKNISNMKVIRKHQNNFMLTWQHLFCVYLIWFISSNVISDAFIDSFLALNLPIWPFQAFITLIQDSPIETNQLTGLEINVLILIKFLNPFDSIFESFRYAAKKKEHFDFQN